MRLGTLALMRPVTTLTLGPLRGEHEVDADGPRLLGELDDRVLDLAALADHEVGELVDDEHDVGHPVLRARRAARVVGGDVALVERRQRLVAVLHLVHDAQLSAARASCASMMTSVSRCGMPSYAASSTRLRSTRTRRTSSGRARMRMLVMMRVDADALARAGRAGDEQVRHPRRGRPRRACPRRPGRARTSARLVASVMPASSKSGAKPTISEAWLGISMPTTSRPGMGASMRMLSRGQRHGQVVGEALDARELDASVGPDLVLRHDRARVRADDVAGIWKLRSFSSMMRTLRSWSWSAASAVSLARSSSVTRGSATGARSGNGGARPRRRRRRWRARLASVADGARRGAERGPRCAPAATAVTTAVAPSGGPSWSARGPALQTVWLSGAGLGRGVGRTGAGSIGAEARPRGGSMTARPIGIATTGRAARLLASGALAPRRRRLRRRRRPRPRSPARRATNGRHERHERDVEQQEEADQDDRDEDDEGARLARRDRERRRRARCRARRLPAGAPAVVVPLPQTRWMRPSPPMNTMRPPSATVTQPLPTVRGALDEHARDEQEDGEQPRALSEERAQRSSST